MGVTIDWSQYTAVREARKRGRAKRRAEAEARGEVAGVRLGLALMLEKKFGALPDFGRWSGLTGLRKRRRWLGWRSQ